MKKYKARIADKMLSRRLLGSGAVLIQGPKWCGKTTTAEQQAKSVVYMDDPEYMEQNVELANLSPKKLLSGEVPRLIDEWQLAPQLWDAARFEVDHRDELGQFIFTGSAVPVDTSKIHHSGTGRFAWLTMRTMSLSESGDSTNEVSLEELFANPVADVFATNPLNIDSLAWNPNLRSKTAIRTSDTRYFSDPSIGVAALGIGPNDLVNDLSTMGLFFESMCIRDLRVYADAIDGTVYHYRDGNGLECDAVVHLRNGNYGLIEVKLGGEKNIEEGAKNLKLLASKIDDTKMKSPSFLMVLTGTSRYAVRRPDGVYVVPIGCLKD